LLEKYVITTSYSWTFQLSTVLLAMRTHGR